MAHSHLGIIASRIQHFHAFEDIVENVLKGGGRLRWALPQTLSAASSMASLRARSLLEFSDHWVTVVGPFPQAASVVEGVESPNQVSLAIL